VARQKEDLRHYVALKAEAESVPFQALGRRDEAARADLRALAETRDDRTVNREFDRLFPLRSDGTRRSSDGLYDGVRTLRHDRVYGMAAFIHDGAHVPMQDKRYLVAAVDVIYDYGHTGFALSDNFYFFTPRQDVVIFGPRRPDKLVYYRKTAPPDLSLATEEISRVAMPAVDPERAMRCTGLQRMVSDKTGKRLMAACVTPVDVGGRKIGTFGTSAPMEGFVRRIIEHPLPDTYNVMVSSAGEIVAHPGIAFPGEVTALERARYERDLGLHEMIAEVRRTGAATGVVQDARHGTIVSYGRIAGPGWYMLIVTPIQKITLGALQSAGGVLLLALIAVALQAALIFGLLRRQVVAPLESLARRSRHADGATAEGGSPEEDRPDEIGELARSLSFERTRNREILQTLEARVRERTHELEVANEEKSRFLANMSHELRTPLNGVVAVADMLYKLQQTESGREYADIIRSSAMTVERVVSDVLDFSKIEAGQIRLEEKPFAVRQLVDNVVKPLAITAAAKGVSVTADFAGDVGETYLGDAHRLAQVLNNLVGNAVKFTAQGTVTVSVTLRDGDLCVSVRDSGVGFTEDVRARLFARFVQADTSITRRYGGSGLGLAICAALVKLMGGQIDAVSRPGEGATFTFTVPMPVCPTHVAPDVIPVERPQAAGSQGRLVVLLAEDHPTNQRVVELILNSADIELEIVENGREALAAFQRRRFDCILMDMQMPEVDGIQAIREIRALEKARRLPRTPIICVSANALAEHVAASRMAGADSHLAKPFQADALLHALAAEIAA
jgi:signal transduction histidine kinase/ActR/RegA family two-component response regulator